MGPYRQSGTERVGSRAHDLYHHSNGVSDHVTIGVRSGSHKPGRIRRSGRSSRGPLGVSIGGVIVVLSLVLVLTVLFYYYISKENGGIAFQFPFEIFFYGVVWLQRKFCIGND